MEIYEYFSEVKADRIRNEVHDVLHAVMDDLQELADKYPFVSVLMNVEIDEAGAEEYIQQHCVYTSNINYDE